MDKRRYNAFEALGLFDGLDDSQRTSILEATEILRLSEGETLFGQGAESDSVYCVEDGVLAVFVVSEHGEETGIGAIGAGEPVGELQILTGGSRTATVRAASAVRLSSLPRKLFLDPEHARLARNIERLIRSRLRHYRLNSVLPKLFGLLESEAIEEIEQRGEWLHLTRGEFLCRAGETDQQLYILVSGRLVAATATKDAGQRVIGEIAAGESVGEMALFTGEKRSADVIAIRDSELIGLSETAFRDLLARFPGIAMGITKIIIGRLRDAVQANGSPRSVKNVCLLPVSKSISIDEVSAALHQAAAAYCSVYCLDALTVERELKTPGIAEVAEDDPAHMRLDAFFNDLENRYDIVIFSADGKDSLWSRRCLHQADKVLLIADADDDPTPSPRELAAVGEVSIASPGRSLILLHGKDTVIPRDTAAWLAGRSVDFCLHVKRGDAAGYRRLARIVSGSAVGVVLSGGGAKGYAHAGVLKALEEAGIEVDMIGGTSIGSVIGAGYALGLTPDEIISQNADLFERHDPFREYTLPIMSVLGSKKLDALFKEAFGETRIEDLWLPYFCVSSNLTTAQERVHKNGYLWKASRASMSLPGILVPVIEGRDLLVDGGVVNNLPADIMQTMCRGTVITVDAAPRRDIEFGEDADSFPSPWKVLRSRLNPFVRSLSPPSILQILGRSTMLASVHNLMKVTAESRYHLEPPVQEFGMLETDKAHEIAKVGYEYAWKIVDTWQELKG